MTDDLPDFRGKKFVDREDLATLADIVRDGIAGESVEKVGRRVIIHSPPKGPIRLKARVWLFEDTGSASAGAEENCPGQRRYAFQSVQPVPCGQYEDAIPGLAGDGDEVVLFEQDNQLVDDQSVQTIEPHLSYLDNTVDPPVWREEWIFSATAASILGDGLDEYGSAEGDTVVVDVVVCTQIDEE